MAPLVHDGAKAASVAEMLKALAHPLRIRIIAILCNGNQTVTALAEQLDASQPIISQQLRILRAQGLIGFRKESGFTHYRILEPRLKKLIRCVDGCESRFHPK